MHDSPIRSRGSIRLGEEFTRDPAGVAALLQGPQDGTEIQVPCPGIPAVGIGHVEVENVLHLHPKILDVAVFGLPDPVMGSIVACAVVPRPGPGKITVKEIQEFCWDQLAVYKIPRIIEFVPTLPKTISGKIRRVELRANEAESKMKKETRENEFFHLKY